MKLLGKLGSKVGANADILGALAAVLGKDPSTGYPNLDSIISSIQQLSAGVIHAPDISAELQRFLNNEGKIVIFAYLGSILLDALNPMGLGKYSKALEKGALAYGGVYLGVRMLYGATHSEIKGINILDDSNSTRESGSYSY